jgi:hypothetical protein
VSVAHSQRADYTARRAGAAGISTDLSLRRLESDKNVALAAARATCFRHRFPR